MTCLPKLLPFPGHTCARWTLAEYSRKAILAQLIRLRFDVDGAMTRNILSPVESIRRA